MEDGGYRGGEDTSDLVSTFLFFSCYWELLDSTASSTFGSGDASRQPSADTHTDTDPRSGRYGLWRILGRRHLSSNPLPSFLDNASEGGSSVNQSGQDRQVFN